MRTILPIFILLFAVFRVEAQFNEKSAKGSFYVSVDDAATIFVNGIKVHHAGIGETRSAEIELRTGDRIVVQLRDDGGERRFVMVFASSDGQSIVNFRNNDYKIIPDLGITDFTPEQFEKLKKSAKDLRQKVALPVKCSSESVWGELNSSILGSVVTIKMFAARSK
jgi:hypothetical protein